MILPDYRGNSIVNLVSSIMRACGARSVYPTLRRLPPEELAGYRNIVLFVIDGLGYDYVLKHKDSVMAEHLKARMTAVFPPTTAASITSFMTGLAPQNHGVTGWFVQLKELGMVTAVLPFKPQFGGMSLDNVDPVALKIFDQKSLFDKLKVKSYAIHDENILYSGYSSSHLGRAKKVPYKNLNGFFKQLKKVVRIKGRKLVYAYWPQFDHLCHHHRKASGIVLRHFRELDKGVASFLKSMKGTNTVLIITADHGLIDTARSRMIKVGDHPVLESALSLPLCGEPRTAYCYVHPSKSKLFLSYVKHKLNHVCDVYRSEDLIKRGLFGLFKPHKHFFDRIGDYVIIMKKNYTIRQKPLGKPIVYHTGVHGGISPEEMFVPLIVIKG